MGNIIRLLIVFFMLCGNVCGEVVNGTYVSPGAAPGTVLIGRTDVTAMTNSDYASGNNFWGEQFVCDATGEIAKSYYYMRSDDNNMKMGIYDSSENLLAESDALSSASDGWNEFTWSGANQITITSGTTYRIGIIGDGTLAIYSSMTTTESGSSSSYPTLPDPWSVTTTNPDQAQVGWYITA